jgi:hypothetical protein
MDHKEKNTVHRKKKAKSRMSHLRRLQKAYNKLLKRYARLRRMVDA